ncbi:MAG: fibronectin type III domain-containing protein [Verrucomicrobiota bacterium]|nr:fibronectin type III domain-containing protein [Verrucomicrobiota bacterium]
MSALELNWLPAAEGATAFHVEKYEAGTWNEIEVLTGDELSYVDRGIPASTEVAYRVIQRNGDAVSPPSLAETGTTLAENPPNPDSDGDGVPHIDDPFPNDPRRKADLPPVFHATVETEGYVDNQFPHPG